MRNFVTSLFMLVILLEFGNACMEHQRWAAIGLLFLGWLFTVVGLSRAYDQGVDDAYSGMDGY